MPVNTTSTGATYGKSSDPLCPLGFHPQVRWPTRCKRCFRDYKEHSDATDKARYGDMNSKSEDDPWSTGVRSGFTKSKSLDVNLESEMPEWKKRMLQRQRREEEEKTKKNKDDEVEDYLARRRQDTANLRSRSAQPEEYRQNDRAASAYERYIQRKEQREASTGEANVTKHVAFKEPEKTSSESSSDHWNTNTTTTANSWMSWKTTNSTTSTSGTSPSVKESYSTKKEESKPSYTSWKETVKEETKPDKSTTPSWKKPETPSWKKPIEDTPSWKKPVEETPSWKKPAEETPSWKKASVDEPSWKTPSWKKTEDTKVSKPPSLDKLGESSSTGVKKKKKKSILSRDSSTDEEKTTTASTSTKTIPSWKKALPSKVNSEPTPTLVVKDDVEGSTNDLDLKIANKEIENLKEEIESLNRKNLLLVKDKEELNAALSKSKSSSSTFESHKASETAQELLKAKEKIREYESSTSTYSKEKKSNMKKIKELESELEKRPLQSETQKIISELQTKYNYMESKCKKLEKENDNLMHNVSNLEGELEEVQDNFREDEADEYRNLKRELELASKNCRVLQFKLKKAEKLNAELEREKNDMETRIKSSAGGSGTLNNINKMRQLEKDLDEKTKLCAKLENDLKSAATKIAPIISQPKTGRGPVLSRTGSVERSVEDQLIKDLQDSIERENDLKEQLSMAEEETGEMRKKLSRIEDENESLASQVKRLSTKAFGLSKSKRSPSPRFTDKDEGISEDGEELSVGELRVQLDVADQETSSLRKKVENLLTDNLKLSKEVKDVTSKLNDEKKKKVTASTTSRFGGSSASSDQNKLSTVQSELNDTRIKLIEKEREFERVESQLKVALQSSSSSNGKLRRTGSQEEDLLKKVNVLEHEASVLRDRNTVLETENEQLMSDKNSSDKSSSNRSLERKIETLESQLSESKKKITALEGSQKSYSSSYDTDRLKRQLDNEIRQLKDNLEHEKRKFEKIEREHTYCNEKTDQAQREVIAAEREKRRAEEERNRAQSSISKLESDVRSLTRERDHLKDESETARRKNRDNLHQTQEGVRAFKEQIESLKSELSEEKNKTRDSKRTFDDKICKLESELTEAQKAKLDACSRVTDLEEKWAKSKRINQQRKDKIESLEKQLDSKNSDKFSTSDKIKDLESKYSSLEKENSTLKKQLKSGSTNSFVQKELENARAEFDLREEEMVVAKARLQTEKEDLEKEFEELKTEYNTIKGELTTLRGTYNTKADFWIKEKLDLQKNLKELEDALQSTAGEGWDLERERFKHIIEDRDSQITQHKIEADVGRSQLGSLRKECDDLKLKLSDYEKMSKFQKAVSSDSNGSAEMQSKLDELKKQLSTEQRERKTELNTVRMQYDSKAAIMGEELGSLKAQCSKYRRERETYKEMLESLQKKHHHQSGRSSGDSEINEYKSKFNDLTYQVQVLEDELADAKLEASKANANTIAHKSNYEIQVAELNSRINELEEEALIDSGRGRIAGTRTKMELAWQKERESQKKLINELNTMARDLKSTLLEVEKERDRDRLESKRKIEGMRKTFDDEQDDTKKQITDLQYDLLELRDAHAKLRTTNEKLRRDKGKMEKEMEDCKVVLKEKSRAETNEDKKIAQLIRDMSDFMDAAPKLLGKDILKRQSRRLPATRDADEAIARTEFQSALLRVKESSDELAVVHKRNEEERMAKKAVTLKRAGSEEGSEDSFRTSRRTLYRKTVSIGETIDEADAHKHHSSVWRNDSNAGSRESLASNASIPLPVPVRTRSAGGGHDPGYSDTYNIRRLERETSIDRMSTGSRDSAMSTQSEWISGEKRSKKSSLIGKLKKLTKAKTHHADSEREFGSGSDISSVSKTSARSSASTFQRAQLIKRERSVSKDRSSSKNTPKNPAQANEPFDKYFNGGGATKPSASSSSPASHLGTLPRGGTFRRY